MKTLILLVCALIAAIPARGQGTAITKVGVPTASNNHSISSSLPTISLRAYGAQGNGAANDSTAFKAALDALATAGGGTLIIPSGGYVLSSAVLKDFQNLASTVVIQGAGSSSQIIVATGSTAALTLIGLEHLVFRDVVFAGQTNVANDALIAVSVSADKAVFENCSFYGIGAFNTGGAVLKATNTDLELVNTDFLGCSGTRGINTTPTSSVVWVENWRGLLVRNVRFIDYGSLNGVYYSKTPLGNGTPWIWVGDAAALTDGVLTQGAVLIENLRMDEAASPGLLVGTTNGKMIENVTIRGLHMNVGTGAASLYLHHIKHLVIEDSAVVYGASVGPLRDGVSLEYIEMVEIKRSRFADYGGRITASETVSFLRLVDTAYVSLASAASQTEIVEKGVSTSRNIKEGSLPSVSNPGEAILVMDASDHKLKISENGGPFRPLVPEDEGRISFVDDFNDNSMNEALWARLKSGGTLAVVEANGELEITGSQNAFPFIRDGYQSVNTYDFTESGRVIVAVKELSSGVGGGDFVATRLALYLDAQNQFEIYYTGTMHFNATQGGVLSQMNAAYNATTMRYWSIRYDPSANTINFETRSQGGTWTTCYSVPRTMNITALRAQLNLAQFNTKTVIGRSVFDDFSLNASASPVSNRLSLEGKSEGLNAILSGTTTWDPPAIADGATTTTTIEVSGARVGNPCFPSHTQLGASNVLLTCHVESDNRARVVLLNKTGANFDLGSGTLRTSVLQY